MFRRFFFALGALLVLSVVVTPAALSAHEGREVGDLEVEVGFLTEPAFEGQVNGAYIHIAKAADDHDHEAMDSMDGMTMDGPDLETHGALFGSGTVESGGSFEFTFDHELEGLTVPYHDHLTGFSGTVTVSDAAEMSGTVMVEFGHDGFSPVDITVQPDTTVMFMNTTDDEVMTVVSGPHPDDHEHVGVTGAAATLQVDVTHIATSTTKTMSLRPIFGDDGGYAADFVPTAPGAYSFRFFGEVEGEPFDETFMSGSDTFDEIEPARNVQFPIELREQRELQGVVEGVQTDVEAAVGQADDAGSRASMALVIGIIGLVVGVAGVGVGAYGLTVSRRKA